MQQLDLFTETIERKIFNLEKRMAWMRRDLEFLKNVYELVNKKAYLPKKAKIEQLSFFEAK